MFHEEPRRFPGELEAFREQPEPLHEQYRRKTPAAAWSRRVGLFCVLVALLTAGLAACASSPPPASPAQGPEPKPELSAPQARSWPLTVDEEQLRDRLKQHVQRLAVDIGERNPEHPWELAEAADYVAGQFEAMGYPVDRQGYESHGVAAQNLAVTVPGGRRGDEVLLVTAHYDSPGGDAGANAGATATAAVLELARVMRDAKLTRTLRFVVFAMGEPPHGVGEGSGSRRFVERWLDKQRGEQEKLERDRAARARGDIPDALPPPRIDRSRLLGVIGLDRLGSFAPPRQSDSLPVHVRVEASVSGQRLLDSLLATLQEPPIEVHPGLIEDVARPRSDEAGSESRRAASDEAADYLAFHEAGVPVAWVHGDGAGPPVDFDAMTRVVSRIRAAVGQISGEKHLEQLGVSLAK